MKETVDTAKKLGDEGFRDVDLGEIQGLTDVTPEELREDDTTEMKASEPAPGGGGGGEKGDSEDTVPENTVT